MQAIRCYDTAFYRKKVTEEVEESKKRAIDLKIKVPQSDEDYTRATNVSREKDGANNAHSALKGSADSINAYKFIYSYSSSESD